MVSNSMSSFFGTLLMSCMCFVCLFHDSVIEVCSHIIDTNTLCQNIFDGASSSSDNDVDHYIIIRTLLHYTSIYNRN
jgi:hypothetical protein